MPPRKRKTVEQVNAETREAVADNTERVRTLTNEGNEDAAKELANETNALIEKLPAEERAALKERLAAATIRQVATKETLTLDEVEGADDEIKSAAARIAEGMRARIKARTFAKEVAQTKLRIAVRLRTRAGDPDLKLQSQAARQINDRLLNLAGEGFERNEETEQELASFVRAVHNQQHDARVEFIKSLDTDDEMRELFAGVIGDDDRPASEVVAEHYGVTLKSAYQIRKERQEAKALERKQGGNWADRVTAELERAETLVSKPDNVDALEEDERRALKAKMDALAARLLALSQQLG